MACVLLLTHRAVAVDLSALGMSIVEVASRVSPRHPTILQLVSLSLKV